jgi:choline dehydrogenase
VVLSRECNTWSKTEWNCAKNSSSSVNTLTFHRPNKGSLSLWAEKVGDDIFEWENFLPYQKRSIAFTPSSDASIQYDPSVYNPDGGPVKVSFTTSKPAFDDYMERAFSASGFNTTQGLNSGILNGYSPQTFTVDPETQTRSSCASSFLEKALQETELKLYTRTLAKKILFEGKRARRVLVETNGAEYVLEARNEIIVSAGVVSLPSLYRSGRMPDKVDTLSTSPHALWCWACEGSEETWHLCHI